MIKFTSLLFIVFISVGCAKLDPAKDNAPLIKGQQLTSIAELAERSRLPLANGTRLLSQKEDSDGNHSMQSWVLYVNEFKPPNFPDAENRKYVHSSDFLQSIARYADQFDLGQPLRSTMDVYTWNLQPETWRYYFVETTKGKIVYIQVVKQTSTFIKPVDSPK